MILKKKKTVKAWAEKSWKVFHGSPGPRRALFFKVILDRNIYYFNILDYTEGERNWMSSSITIDGAKRLDDGLYECLVQ